MLDKENYKRNLDEDLDDQEEKLHSLFKVIFQAVNAIF
jgi:hypothetical protein